MKKLLPLLLTLSIMFSLAACGQINSVKSTETVEPQQMEYSEFQWPDTEIAKLMPVPKSSVGNIGWSKDYGFVIYVTNTTQSDFKAYADDCAARGFTENVNSGDAWYYADNEDGYHVSLKYQDGDVMFVRIDRPDEQPSESVDISEPPEEVQPIEEEPAVTETPEPTQEPVSEPEPAEPTEKPVYYSTNTFDKAKNGNAGVFSYKRKGANYDFYWIVDLDENCAYSFTYGNGSTTCDRVQIEKGDLNNYILLTYHDGDSSWQYGLCFKRARQPDRLIQSEADGTQYEYVATDLEEALKLLDQLTIVDY